MFKTFKDNLVEVEQLYNAKNYHATVLENAKLAERQTLSYTRFLKILAYRVSK